MVMTCHDDDGIVVMTVVIVTFCLTNSSSRSAAVTSTRMVVSRSCRGCPWLPPLSCDRRSLILRGDRQGKLVNGKERFCCFEEKGAAG